MNQSLSFLSCPSPDSKLVLAHLPNKVSAVKLSQTGASHFLRGDFLAREFLVRTQNFLSKSIQTSSFYTFFVH
jgi:hypothetical protein